jgi:hypothetical protein
LSVIYSLQLNIYEDFGFLENPKSGKRNLLSYKKKNYPHPSKSEISVVTKISGN